jgi:hypothetical protein
MIGGAGDDIFDLSGGGADVIDFNSVEDSMASDTINGFGEDDLIDLSGIVQFTYSNGGFIGGGTASVYTVDNGNGSWEVYADNDGDGVSDFHLNVEKTASGFVFDEADFSLIAAPALQPLHSFEITPSILYMEFRHDLMMQIAYSELPVN